MHEKERLVLIGPDGTQQRHCHPGGKGATEKAM